MAVITVELLRQVQFLLSIWLKLASLHVHILRELLLLVLNCIVPVLELILEVQPILWVLLCGGMWVLVPRWVILRLWPINTIDAVTRPINLLQVWLLSPIRAIIPKPAMCAYSINRVDIISWLRHTANIFIRILSWLHVIVNTVHFKSVSALLIQSVHFPILS